MADPVVTEVAGGLSATATTTVMFTAPAGVLLLLHVVADDYRATAGAGRPESTGWTLAQYNEGNLGHYLWWKLSTGDTQVQYTINSATRSVHAVTAASNVAGLDGSAKNLSPVSSSRPATYTTPSVTASAGRRVAFGVVGTAGPASVTMAGWTGGYTEVHDRATTTGYRDGLGVAWLVFDGGATSTTVTITGQTEQQSGFTAVFTVAQGAGSFPASGVVASATAVTGVVTATMPVTGVLGASSGATGVVTVRRPTVGAAGAVSGVAGAVTGILPATGLVVSSSTVAGEMTLPGGLAGVVASSSTVTGLVTVRRTVTGVVGSGSVVAGAVTTQYPVNGLTVTVSTVTGVMESPGGLSGTVTSTSHASGMVTARLTATGVIETGSSSSGFVATVLTVNGLVVSVSDVTGRVVNGGIPSFPTTLTLTGDVPLLELDAALPVLTLTGTVPVLTLEAQW